MSRAGGYVCPISQHGLARSNDSAGCGAENAPCFMVAEEREEGRSRALGGLGLLLLPALSALSLQAECL